MSQMIMEWEKDTHQRKQANDHCMEMDIGWYQLLITNYDPRPLKCSRKEHSLGYNLTFSSFATLSLWRSWLGQKCAFLEGQRDEWIHGLTNG